MLPLPDAEFHAIAALEVAGDHSAARARAAALAAQLSAAVVDRPQDAALRGFLALALHAAGRPTLALATMLEAALAAARPDGFEPHVRTFAEYKARLLNAAMTEGGITGD